MGERYILCSFLHWLTFKTLLTGSVDPLIHTSAAIPILDSALLPLLPVRLRLSFLDHLEQWKAETGRQATDTVTGKVQTAWRLSLLFKDYHPSVLYMYVAFPFHEEEAHTELELRLHLHEPRPSRVEQDIHNVRAGRLAPLYSISLIMSTTSRGHLPVCLTVTTLGGVCQDVGQSHLALCSLHLQPSVSTVYADSHTFAHD